MAVASIVENIVKYKEGKKWKERFCILRKPSPVADCLSVMLYKDSSKQTLKSNLVLDEFCGIETTPFDGEKYILSIICCNKTLLLSFSTGEVRDIWREKLRANFGGDMCFKVEVTHGLPDQRLSGPAFTSSHSHSPVLYNLFLTSSRMSLTTTENSTVILKHLCSWRYTDLKRCGMVGKNSYGIQFLCKEGEKNFVLKTHQSFDIDKALKTKVQSLVQSCGLFEQLICSIAVTNQSAFPASASNPSTPTYCISSESSHLNHSDRRFSSPNSQMPPKGHTFCNSLENTAHHVLYGKPISTSRNDSFGDAEQLNASFVRHFSEWSLHTPVQENHSPSLPVDNLDWPNSCEETILSCIEQKDDKLNYINYEVGENLHSSRSDDLSNEESKHRKVLPLGSFMKGIRGGDSKSVDQSLNGELYHNESHANITMMNGGFCANKSVNFDPLQPLPYRDLSRYDGETDEGYLYWLPGSPGDPKKCNPGYINISSIETKDNIGEQMKSKVKVDADEYLTPNLSLDSLNADSLKCFRSPAGDQAATSYVNMLGVSSLNTPCGPIPDDSKENLERTFMFPQETNNNDYIHINQLGSGIKGGSLKVKSDLVEQGNVLSEYMDMTGRQELQGESRCEAPSLEAQDSYRKPSDSISFLECGFNKIELETSSEKFEDFGILTTHSNDEDLIRKILMSPPAPIASRQSLQESQEYINLSSVSMGETVALMSPPPRPPKTLNCIKEDASESTIPPPLPEKVKHQRGILDHDFAPLHTPARRRDQSGLSDSYPKPPLPSRRTSHSPVNLHCSPPPGTMMPFHNRGSTLSFSLSNSQAHLGSRPVSASSVQKHRKPNLTVDIESNTDLDQGKPGTPISVGSKWHPDDLNRSLPALAIYKPRNGKEYLDRRRLTEESIAPSFPPNSAQKSPSVASVFTFDDKSLSSTNPLSGWYSSGEDSPKYPSSAISVRSSMRSMRDQKRSIGHRELSCNGSPCSYRFDYLESPRTFSTSTVDSIDTVINYADIDVFPGEFCFDQSKLKFVVAASPPATPDSRTVYAKIDVAATSAASKVGKHHAKQREDTLEKRAESAVLTKLQSCDGNIEKRKLSLDLKKQSSLSIKD